MLFGTLFSLSQGAGGRRHCPAEKGLTCIWRRDFCVIVKVLIRVIRRKEEIVVIIAGNVGNVATRQVNGKNGPETVLDVSVAENYRKGQEKKTAWYRFSLWGKYAETMNQYIVKGTVLQVSGILDPRAYTPKNGGEPGVDLTILQPVVTLLGGGKREEGSAPAAAPAAAPAPAPAPAPEDGFTSLPDDDDELPFA